MTNYLLGKVVGDKGNGIEKIELIDTTGLVKTYRITYTDGDHFDYEVTDGEDGSTVSVTQVLSSGTKLATLTIDGTSTDLYCSEGGTDIVTSWESTLSDEKVPSEKLTKDTLDTKISKSSTSGLVKNDGTIDTTSYVSDVSGKEDTSNKVTSWSGTTTDTHYPSEKLVKTDLDNKISKSSTTGLMKNDGTVDTTSYISSLPSASTSTSGIVQLVDNLTTNDDTKALTAKQGKALYDAIAGIENDMLS